MNIDRREFLMTAGAGTAGLALGGLAGGCSTPQRKPNIIYILADDLGYGDLGCYGQTKIRTPNLDRMAAEGMRFTQHYAGSTVCAPSRCCLMTGLHSGHAYVRGNRPIDGYQLPLPEGTLTVASQLQQAGYRTGLVGKWGLGGPGTSGHPNRQGFDYFYGYLGQAQAHFYYPPHLWENERKVPLDGNEDGGQSTYSHDAITERALEFIRENKDDPFFLYMALTIPHAELKVPEDSLIEYRGEFEEKPYPGRHYGAQEWPRAAYAAMVSRMDRDVGRVRELIRGLGLEQDTLIMFSSDNGPHREGGHSPAFFNSSGPLRGIKRDLYEGGIRVPMVACWPGTIRSGAVSDHVSAFWDLLPTCCELAGAEVPAGMDGISFTPVLLGERPRRHEYLYWEFHERGGKQAVRWGKWKGVRLNVKADGNAPLELYDLSVDLTERQDIAADHPDLVQKMAALMAEAHVESNIFVF